MATQETLIEKIADYAKAVGGTLEDAFDAVIAHVEAKKAEIDASQAPAEVASEPEAVSAPVVAEASESLATEPETALEAVPETADAGAELAQ